MFSLGRNEKRTFKGPDWLGIVSFGFFLVLFGTIWMITPNFTGKVEAFFRDFHLENVTENITLPAPEHKHPVVYSAAMQFCFVFGAFQFVVLALRFVLNEPLDKKGGTISGIVFWLCAGFFLSMLANGTIGWFSFLAGLIVSIGLTIIASSIIKLFKKAQT